MKCDRCGKINKEDSIYCEQCGKIIKNNELFNEIKIDEEKIKKDKKRFMISSIINYLVILIIYAINGYIIYLTKTENEFTASVAAWCLYYFLIFLIIISLHLFIMSTISGIVAYKRKKDSSIIINLILLSLIHLPILITIFKIVF